VAERLSADGLKVTAVGGAASCDAVHHYANNLWIDAENPPIAFASPDPASVEVFSASELAFEPLWSPDPAIAGSIMITTKVTSRCQGVQAGGKTFFGLERTGADGNVNGTDYYSFDRRLSWIRNTLADPASVTADEYSGGKHGVCPSVPRTFVNEASCVRLPAGYCTNPAFLSRMFKLEESALKRWFADSAKYVVTGEEGM
jgi:hypothetical protein